MGPPRRERVSPRRVRQSQSKRAIALSLNVYNTLSREKERFEPLDPPRVGVYVCGPTVYGHSHLGHAKSYVSFDVIVRWLRARGYMVNYVQNITDVGHLTDDADAGEDKVIVEARRRGLHPMAVVEIFVKSYLDDMDALNWVRPDIMPRASGHITEQIAQIHALIERGCAYAVDGSVYFDVTSFADYGKLSGRRLEELEAGARIAVNSEKRNPADFALWKCAADGHIMRWPSPWGEGYPGWHIECSAMSQKYLGETFDIHGGGLENQFPHHECEIAQGECATGKPFARYWLHNNMCTLNGQKMGKSLGNAISLKQVFHDGHELLEKTYEPAVVRHLILISHYRQPLDFSDAALQAAESGSYKLRDTLQALREKTEGVDVNAAAVLAENKIDQSFHAGSQRAASDDVRDALQQIEQRFAGALDEDFNTAQGVALLFDLAKQSQSWLTGGAKKADLAAARTVFEALACEVLGFRWRDLSEAGGGQRDDLIRILVDLRAAARQRKDFGQSDEIRDRLLTLGVELRDGPDGTTW